MEDAEVGEVMGTNTAIQRLHNRWKSGPEWYTPPALLARISDFLPDYYDPCPPSGGHIIVNGLLTSWAGRRVFCNPPYGKLIEPWVTQFCTQRMSEGILLVPAYTDTRWFAPLFGYSLLFVRGRISFVGPDSKGYPAPHASVLVYRGRRHQAFAEAFADLGPVLRTIKAQKRPRDLWT